MFDLETFGYILAAILTVWFSWQFYSPSPVITDFSGKIVLITGAGSGIGRKMALRFSELHATVVIWDIFEEGMQATEQSILASGGKAKAYHVDITDEARVMEAARAVAEDIGRVDVLVNNAGVVFGRRILDASSTHIRRTLDVNLLSHFWTIRAFLPPMLQAGSGHIVTVSSVCSMVAFDTMADYCASKAGSFALSESLRQELYFAGVSDTIHTTQVLPYFIKTGMFGGLSVGWIATLIAGAPLTEDGVAERIVLAVRARESVVIMPRQLWLLTLMRLVPVPLADWLQRLVGVAEAMKTFHGRGAAFNFGQPAAAASSGNSATVT